MTAASSASRDCEYAHQCRRNCRNAATRCRGRSRFVRSYQALVDMQECTHSRYGEGRVGTLAYVSGKGYPLRFPWGLLKPPWAVLSNISLKSDEQDGRKAGLASTGWQAGLVLQGCKTGAAEGACSMPDRRRVNE